MGAHSVVQHSGLKPLTCCHSDIQESLTIEPSLPPPTLYIMKREELNHQ